MSGGYKYQEIILNSEDFSYGDLNKPIFQFNQIIDESALFQVHRCIVPFSYYVFDSERTSMQINGINYSWPQGNYTATDWTAYMNALLPPAIRVTWDNVTNKLTFTYSTNVPFTIVFASNELVHEELGFNAGTTTSVSNLASTAHVIVAPRVANFSGPNFLYLRSPQASIFNNVGMFYSRNNVDSNSANIMAMIPLGGNRFTVTDYVDQSGHLFQWKTIGNKRLEFYFTLGNRTTPVDFNGQSFQLRLHGVSYNGETPFRVNS